MAGGITAATGSMTIAPPKDNPVSGRVQTPWTDTTYPARGDRVEIWAVHNGVEAKIFTGRVDDVKGGVDTLEVTLGLVDDYDALGQEIQHTALARMMPPLSTTGDGYQRMTGLLSPWVTSMAARQAGFCSTPPMDAYCLVSAPLQGSTWPERGVLRDSYRHSDVGEWSKYHPGATTEPDGWLSMTQLIAKYEPDPYNTPYNSGITSARPLSITMMAGRWQSTSSYVAARWDTGHTLRIACAGNRDLSAQYMAPDGTVRTVAFMSSSTAGDWSIATAQWELFGTGSLKVTLYTDTGKTAEGTITAPMGSKTKPIFQVWVYAPSGNYIAGAQVSFTSLPAATRFRRSASIQPAKPLRNLNLVPALAMTPAAEILNAQAEAELAALWVDEDGVLQYRDTPTLLGAPVTRTFTSARDVIGLSWSTNSQDVRRKVTVKYRSAAVSIARRSRITVYEGQKSELAVGEDSDIWIDVPDDEEWIQADSTPRTVYGDYNASLMNSGEGSFIGFTGLTKDGDEIPILDGTKAVYTLSFNLVGRRGYRAIIGIAQLPSNADRVTTQTRTEDATSLKKAYRGIGLPLIRAMGKGTWADQEATPGVTGPSWATDLSHDAGWFVQDQVVASSLAQTIAEQTKAPYPLLDDLPVRPDPRVQLGDKVRVQDPHRTGLSLLGVVCGIDQSIGAGSHEMKLSLIVTTVQHAYVTLGEFDSFYRSLGQVDETFKQETLASRDNSPLRK